MGLKKELGLTPLPPVRTMSPFFTVFFYMRASLNKRWLEKEDKGLSGVGWSNFFDVRQLGQIYIKHLKDCSVVGYPKVPSSNA